MEFLETAPNSGEFILIKAGVVLAYYGGLGCADLVNLESRNLEFNDTTGMWVSYKVSKQRGEALKKYF